MTQDRPQLEAFGRSSVRSTVVTFANVGLGGLTGLLAAAVLGAEGRGVYAAVSSWYLILVVLGNLGLAQAVTYDAARRPGELSAFLRAADRVSLGSSCLVMVTGIAVFLLVEGFGVVGQCAVIALATVPLANYLMLRLAGLVALDNRAWNRARCVQPAVYLTIVALASVLSPMTPQLFFVAMAASIATGALAVLFVFRPAAPDGQGVVLAPSAYRRGLLTFALPSLASTLPSVLSTRVDQIAIALTGDYRALGAYALAVAIGLLVTPLSAGVGFALMPHLASGRGLVEARLSTARTSLLITGAATAALLGAAVFLSVWLVPRAFGQDFEGFARLMFLLAPGIYASAIARLAGDALRGLGNPRAPARADLVALGVAVLLLAVLVPLSGATGAAIASSASYLVGAVLMLWGLRQTIRESRHVSGVVR